MTHLADAPPSGNGTSHGSSALFRAWQSRASGFAPLFLEPVMGPALDHLAPAIRPDTVALDLGSGGGHVADAIRACGARAIGLDVEPGVLEASRRAWPGGEPVAGDAAALPLADASVDAVFCFSVLQYVDRDATLAEIRRVLRPGGRAALIENLVGNPAALAYRAWRRVARIRYPDRLTPRRRIRWSERERFRAYFPDAQAEAHFLLAPFLLIAPAVSHATARERGGSGARRALGLAERADSMLLRIAPALRNAAWMLLVKV